MSLAHEFLQVGHAAEFRVHGQIIPDRVITAEAAFAVFDTNGIYRHQPEYIHTHLFKTGKMLLKGLESAFGGVLPYVHFINCRVTAPAGVNQFPSPGFRFCFWFACTHDHKNCCNED